MPTATSQHQPRQVLLDTVRGPARAWLHQPAGRAHGWAVLLHGAGSGVSSAPLRELAVRLAAGGVAVAAVDQPYRVAGRRAPDRAPMLDAVLVEVVPQLRRAVRAQRLPLVVAGRSSGARVACRTRSATGAIAVLALGFPFQPPRGGADRGGELAAAGELGPVLVVQGQRDPFGCPPSTAGVLVRQVPGGHSPSGAAVEIGASWLLAILGQQDDQG